MGEQEARKVVEQWNGMRTLDRHSLARQNEHYEVHPDFKAARDRAIGLMNESEEATWNELRGQLRVQDRLEVPDREMREYLRHADDGAERAVLGELMKDKLIEKDRLALSGPWLSVQEGIRRREEREQRKHHPRL